MLKCEVLKDSILTIGKGSIVLVSERQFELARQVLKPIKDEPKKEKKKKTEEE